MCVYECEWLCVYRMTGKLFFHSLDAPTVERFVSSVQHLCKNNIMRLLSVWLVTHPHITFLCSSARRLGRASSIPNKLMSMDFLKTANGIHSSSPSATQVAQLTTAHKPLAPSGRCSEMYSEASSIWNKSQNLFVFCCSNIEHSHIVYKYRETTHTHKHTLNPLYSHEYIRNGNLCTMCGPW